MKLHVAVVRQKIKEFIQKRDMMLFIESLDMSNVEVILAVRFDEVSMLQELLPHDFLEDNHLNGDVNGDYLHLNINDIMLWAELELDDFIDQLEDSDQERLEKWKHRQDAKSA
jgi:hypothetical protein